MKALIISSLVFFSLRAMSGEVGEDKKGECVYSNQSNKRDAKIVSAPMTEDKKEAVKTLVK